MPSAQFTGYAGFWIRVVAALIDAVILLIPGFLLNFLTPVIGWIASMVVYWLYVALLESSVYQATVGKMALGLKVTDMQGARISFGRATVRYFSQILCGLTLGIGYIVVGFTQKKQGLHDFIAQTLVFKTR
jgi:uncharacterized RDD family membrane protein YckC